MSLTELFIIAVGLSMDAFAVSVCKGLAVKKAGIKEMIIVVGYCGENLIRYINENHSDGSVSFKFIDNKDYAISNNIYSFYMARL